MESIDIIPKIELNMTSERKILNEYFSNGLIQIPKKCDKCSKNISIKENNTLISPYIGRCCNPQCRKIYYLRECSLFNLFSKTSISLIKYVIVLNLDFQKNAKQIYELLKNNNADLAISQQHINHILDIMRYIIAHYMKDCYYLEKIAELNGHASISIDESLFVHQVSKSNMGSRIN